MTWETVIGLEIHAQLLAESKIFSPAPAAFSDAPNTQVREVDWGLPGALPVLNRRAVEAAMRLGLALSATVNRRSEFARKNYFYPDLPKGYQISQFEYPIVEHGELWIAGKDGGDIRIGVTRAHLEEDAGKLLHENWHANSGVDLNRAGTPLLEIVSEPDLRDIADAVTYATELRRLVCWLGICDGNMQEGSFRIDANISVRRADEPLGTRCEIKNLNSFRFLEQALQHERQRQIDLLEDGGEVVQETRLFDPARGETRALRGKEDAHDYRYFPDPDLPPLVIDDTWLQQSADNMPELPQARRQRFMDELQLSAYDAALLTAEKGFSDYFEAVLNAATHTPPPREGAALEAASSLPPPPRGGAERSEAGGGDAKMAKLCANWMCGDFSALLNTHKCEAADSKISEVDFAELMRAISDGIVSGKIAKTVLEKMWESGAGANEIIERDGLRQISDSSALEAIAKEIIAAHPAQAEQYRSGKEKLLGFFVGQMMKATKGQANPEQANTVMKEALGPVN